VVFVAFAAVGIVYLGQSQIGTMLDTRARMTGAGETILVEVQRVQDAARTALAAIEEDGRSVKRDREHAARISGALVALEKELRAHSVDLERLLSEAKPFTLSRLWALSDNAVRAIFLFLLIGVALLVLNAFLRLVDAIRELPD
jgi:hypothetical protein